MNIKYTIEISEKHIGNYCFFVTPYGEIKYRKNRSNRRYYLYIEGRKIAKVFKTKRKVKIFCREWIIRQFLNTHETGLKILFKK